MSGSWRRDGSSEKIEVQASVVYAAIFESLLSRAPLLGSDDHELPSAENIKRSEPFLEYKY